MATVLNTITDLKNFDPSQSESAHVRGYGNVDDGGGGLFVWDTAGTAAEDDGGYSIASTVSGYGAGEADEGVWRRVRGEAVVAIHFGFGVNPATDESDRLQAALDFAAGDELFITRTGRAEGIRLDTQHSGTTIRGTGGAEVLKPSSPTVGVATFQFADNISGTVEDIHFVGIKVRNDTRTQADVVDDPDATLSSGRTSAWETRAPSVSGASGGTALRWKFTNCVAQDVNGFGFRIYGAGSVTLVNCDTLNTSYDGFSIWEGNVEAKFIGCTSKWAGRHNFSVTVNPTQNDVQFVDCYGEDAWFSGCDIEHGSNIHFDITIYRASRSGGNEPINAAVRLSVDSKNISGEIRAYDCKNHALYSNAENHHNLTVNYRYSNSSNNTIAVAIKSGGQSFKGGILNVNGWGGGHVYDGAVNIDNIRRLTLNASITKANGPSVGLFRTQKCTINLGSEDPVQQAGATHKAHLFMRRLGGVETTDNLINIVAKDGVGNAEYGVLVGAGSPNRNVYVGNVHDAYSVSGTSGGIGASSKTSQLIT